MFAPSDFFEINNYYDKNIFDGIDPVWDTLKNIRGYIEDNIEPNILEVRKRGDVIAKTLVIFKGEIFNDGFEINMGSPVKGEFSVKKNGEVLEGAIVLFAGASIFDDQIQIGEGSVVEPGALVKGPTIIGKNAEIRQGAYIRGSCLVGDNCIVGHSTEMKNSVMLDRVTAGHFAYIGDSILGNDVNLGAGTKLANLSIVGSKINLRINNQIYRTGLKKFGAILGDSVETGCNSVTSPGTLMGKKSLVVPNSTVPSGYHPQRTIIR
jgi:NDP-sugar pyrophosphorylase family protein